MAEFVQFRAEEWVTELEQMERIGLFEPKEIRTIVRKRKEFEYKTQRKTKCKEDYLKYIQFEVDLHRIIKARRKKTGIKSKKGEIDFNQIQRITNIFKVALIRFSSDVKLWMSFFKFCEGAKLHSLVSQMLVRMLQIHADKADLWVFAAKWELEQCLSVTNARQFLTRGLRNHPSCALLYQELFKLELQNRLERISIVKKKKAVNENFVPDEVTNNIIQGKVAEVVYMSAVKEIEGVDFKVSMFNISLEKRAPSTLKNKIFQMIIKHHADEELTWDTLAQQEAKGFHYDLNQLTGEGEKMEIDENNKLLQKETSFKVKILNSINVYEEAVKKFNSVKMWSYYLDFVINLNKNAQKLIVFKTKLLNNAMKGAMASGKMAEKYYVDWINRLQKVKNSKVELSGVLEKATEDHPKSLQLWHAHLKFSLIRDCETLGMEVFKKAIGNLPDAAPLWSLVVKYLLLNSSSKTEEVLQNGIRRGGEVAQILKPFYMEWLVKTKGIKEARIAFESSEMNLYPCLEFYKKMSDLELSQDQPCLDKVRRCHDLACKYFGANNPSVWLDYVKFELRHGDVSKVAKIHRKALKNLKSESVDEFLVEYNKFKIDVSS